MDERQRQFAQFASVLNQFAGNTQGTVDRGHRDRSTNDGRSSTGSTSSGSSSIISNNGNNVAAAVAAVASGGSAAMWGELNRAMQYGYPPFTPGAPWPPAQGGPDFYRLGNFGAYNDGGNDGRGSEGRSEGRRVPSKGETKATPPLPPGLTPSRGSTLASLQQLVNLPNEEVYKLIAAQQYAAALSTLPASSRPQLSPGANASHSSISPVQMHPNPNISSRHQNMEHSNQQFAAQQRYRQSGRNVSPLSNASPDGLQGSPSPDNGSLNGDYSDVGRREDRLSPHPIKRKDLTQTGQIRVSPNLMPTKPPHAADAGIPIQSETAYPYDLEPQQSQSHSRVSDGPGISGSDSEGDQKYRSHRRKQHQPRRQTVIYSGMKPARKDLQQVPPTSADSSSDDSRECEDMPMGRDVVNRADIPPALSRASHNPVASMSSAMSHALSHPFLAPHLNQPDRKFDNPVPIAVESQEKKLVSAEIVVSPPADLGGIRIASDLMATIEKTAPLSAMKLPDILPGDHTSVDLDSVNSEKSALSLRTKKANCVSGDYCTPVKKRKLSQVSPEHKALKRDPFSGDFCGTVESQVDSELPIDCDSKEDKGDVLPNSHKSESLDCENVVPKLDDITDGVMNEMDVSESHKGDECKLVNGDHTPKSELLSPAKLSDLSDDYYDCGKRRMRQKRPISYVEDETDPVQETNEDAMPLYSPTRRRGRRSKEKSDSSLSPTVSFPSISVRDPASLYEQPEFVNSGRKLLQDIPEKVKEPLHIDTNVSQGSLPSANQFMGLRSPDIYDFNDTDGEGTERQHKKRGRKRGSPRKSERSPAEFVRASPRKESLRLPKLFPCVRTPELVDDKKESFADDEPPPHFPTTVSIAEGAEYHDGDLVKGQSTRARDIAGMETNSSGEHHTPQHNNNYDKEAYEPYSTISPTKLASLCQEPLETYVPNSFHTSELYRKENHSDKCTLEGDCNDYDEAGLYNNNRPQKRPKKRKRGRPKGSRSSPRKDSVSSADPLDVLMSMDKNGLSNIPISEQTVNVSVAQFPSPPRTGGRGRRKKRPSKNSFSPKKSAQNNVRNSNGPSPASRTKNEKGRNTQNSLCSFPDIEPESVKAEDNSDANDRSNSNQEPKLECDGETMEDIEQFLKETAPPSESTPMKTDTSSSSFVATPNLSSALSTPSTSDNAYRESRPKRISRPPPELPEGEMNDLLLLLNMEGEDSDDEDYIPKHSEDPGSDSRLSLTSDLEDDSDSSPPTPVATNGPPNEIVTATPKITKGDKKKPGRKPDRSRIREEPRKKTDEKLERRGPYVRLRAKGSTDVIVNAGKDDDEREPKNARKTAVPFHVDKEVKNVKVGFNSTLHPNYNAFTRDMNWYCAFCKMYSHHCSMGDLFGPYFINSSSPSKKNYPTVTEGQVEETISSPEEAASRYTSRRTPRGDAPDFEIRKSEVWESPPMRFVPSATAARMLQGRGGVMRTPERGNLNSPRLMPGSSSGPTGPKCGPKVGKNLNTPQTPSEKPPGTECWVHVECLLWSSGVTAVNSRLLGLDGAVISAQDSVCSHCKESGATVCCLRRGCHLTVHLPCARFLRWSLDNELFLSHCPLHVPSKVVSK